MAAVETGGGTTITLGTTGAAKTLTARIRSIEGYTKEGVEIDDSDLTTTGFAEFVPGDLYDPGSFSFVAIHDSAQAAAPACNSASETITITRSGAGSTVIGSGFVKTVKHPDYAQNEPLLGTVTIRWDGITPPAHAT